MEWTCYTQVEWRTNYWVWSLGCNYLVIIVQSDVGKDDMIGAGVLAVH